MKRLTIGPARKRPAESQDGPATRDVDECAMVAKLLETIKLMIAQLAAKAARGGENPPVCEERVGFDSPEYVDFFYDDTSGRALDPPGETSGTWSSSRVLECGKSCFN